MTKLLFIIPPNFYVVNEDAAPPTQLEPFFKLGNFELFHLYRGDALERIPEADYYGITAYTEDYVVSEVIAKYLKSRNPKAKIILGGSHATCRYNDISSLFDYVIIGPGEDFIKGFLDSELPQNRIFNGQFQAIDYWSENSFHKFRGYIPGLHRGTTNTYSIRTSTGC